MTITKGVDVYTTVAEVDALFAVTIYNDTWSGLTVTEKEEYIRSATMELDTLSWVGMVVDESQPLAFPRTDVYWDKVRGMTIPMDPTPKAIENACAYQAFSLISSKSDLIGSSSSDAESIKIGELEITGMGGGSSSNTRKNSNLSPMVKNIIRPMISKGNTPWWRAN